jgi:signal transduction histidine kinase
MVEEFMSNTKIDCVLRVIGSKRRLSNDAELALYRITQEALRNIEKHSKATKSMVEIKYNTIRATLIITDNGNGFKLPRQLSFLVREGKLGLVSIDQRSRLVGGSTNVESEVGKGTKLVVELPIQA